MNNNPMLPAGAEDERNRYKRDEALTCPSRVLHLRQIPNETTEEDVVSLGIPFGKVSNVLVLNKKHQAFLEMTSEESAIAMMTYYTPSLPSIHDQPVYIQFSNHKELKIDHYNSQVLLDDRGSVVVI